MTVSNSLKSKFNKLTTEQMATGGVANVLYQGITHFPHSKLLFSRSRLTVPYRFPGLYSIGCTFFLFNICLFIFNITMISLRFRYYPSTFVASFLHPTESLFVPAWLISLGTILINITQYGTTIGRTGEWLLDTMFVLFWVYCVLAIVFSCGIYLVMWSTQTFTISQMTPVWIFPAYPLLVIGPHAGVLSAHISTPRALEIIVAGWTFQGIGFLVSLMIYASFIYRLMTQKLPRESLRPGMFISVGPSGFTIAGVVTMGQVLPNVVPDDFMGNGYLTGQVFSAGAHWSCVRDGRMTFAMTWYSYIFPNTALTTATFAIGRALDNVPIKVFGCVLACLLVIAWFTVFSIMIRAVIMKDILWPQKQEDREEGGWRTNPDEKMACDTRRCDDEDVSAAAKRGQTLDVEHTDYQGPSEPRDTGQSVETTLPAIAETLVDESVRGRGVKQADSMV
ncbi:hypothetical protein LTR37_017982 [Vermiconidia calcicola]|uniref:Uncharacterized protein n=1 Tax=Vermiconidia calcicola TaxID=1690605 RepID=A0ACC3MIF0_9PEZI|nr:hypothetical protein LTR37_017982 [Vermiconidia calcicola]